MVIQFVGRMSELLGCLGVIVKQFPEIRACEVNALHLEEARYFLRRN